MRGKESSRKHVAFQCGPWAAPAKLSVSLGMTALAGTIAFGGALGCSSSRARLADNRSAARMLADAEQPGAAVVRSQKPDAPASNPGDAPRAKPNSVKAMVPINYTELADISGSQTACRIRATVNSQPILDEEVREVAYPMLMATMNVPEPARAAQQREIMQRELQRLIEREVILTDAFALLKTRQKYLDKLKEAAGKEFDKQVRSMRDRAQVKTDEELKDFLTKQGVSLESMRRQSERNFMAMEYMRSRIGPAIERIGHKEIEEYYNAHPEEFQVEDAVKWQDIFVDVARHGNRAAAHAFAQKLAGQARAGEDFKLLGEQFDNGDSAYRNGDGYGNRRGEIRPADAEPILFQLKDGEIGPIIEQPNGFHVIRLVKRTHAGIKPFDVPTQSAIKTKLQNEVWEKEYKRIISELKRKANIEIAGMGGQ